MWHFLPVHRSPRARPFQANAARDGSAGREQFQPHLFKQRETFLIALEVSKKYLYVLFLFLSSPRPLYVYIWLTLCSFLSPALPFAGCALPAQTLPVLAVTSLFAPSCCTRTGFRILAEGLWFSAISSFFCLSVGFFPALSNISSSNMINLDLILWLLSSFISSWD